MFKTFELNMMAQCGLVPKDVDDAEEDDCPVVRTIYGTVSGKSGMEAKSLPALNEIRSNIDYNKNTWKLGLLDNRLKCKTTLFSLNRNERIIRYGRIRKLGKFKKSWKNRFFVLLIRNEEVLFYYYKSALDKTLLGEVPFVGQVHISPIDETTARRLKATVIDACFCIETDKRRWLFCAEKAEVRDKWVDVLRRHLMNVRCAALLENNLNNDWDSFDEKWDQEQDVASSRQRRKQVLRIDPLKWDILCQSDNWNEFTKNFEELRFKLEPPDLLNVQSVNELGRLEFSDSCKSVFNFLKDFYGKGRLISGWLFKRGRFNRSWRKRFCVLLDDGTFEYWKTPTDATPQGKIVSNEMKSIVNGLSVDGLQVFHIATQGRLWILGAPDDHTRDIWINKLEARKKMQKYKSEDIDLSRTNESAAIEDGKIKPQSSKSLDNEYSTSSKMWMQYAAKNMIHVKSEFDLLGIRGTNDSAGTRELISYSYSCGSVRTPSPKYEDADHPGERTGNRRKVNSAEPAKSKTGVNSAEKMKRSNASSFGHLKIPFQQW